MQQTNNDIMPLRKPNRLKDYDYSQNGAYFVTICVKDYAKLFSEITTVGANCVRLQLSAIGKIVDKEIAILGTAYKNITVEKYVIMPNHVHMILNVTNENGRNESGRTQFSPTANADENGRTQVSKPSSPLHMVTISRAIKQWKGVITKKAGFPIWQKSFHDHVIRNEEDYHRILEYIENNPIKWTDDRYHA